MSKHYQNDAEFDRIASQVIGCVSKSIIDLLHAAEFDLSEDLKHFDWSGVSFEGADLSGCDFTGARLDGCSFKDATIAGAIFDDEQIVSGILAGARDYEEYSRNSKGVDFYRRLIVDARSKPQISSIFSKYDPGILLDSTEQVNHIIRLSSDFQEAVESLNLFTAAGLAPNIETFEFIAHLAEFTGDREQRHSQVQRSIELGKQWGIKPSSKMYGRLIGTAEDFRTAEIILKEVQISGVELAPYMYARLIERAPDFKSGIGKFLEMSRGKRISPSRECFRALIQISEDLKTANRNLLEIQKRDLGLEIGDFNLVMSKISASSQLGNTRPLNAGIRYAKKARDLQISWNSDTYEQLIRLSPNFSVALRYLSEMRKKRVVLTYGVCVAAAGRVAKLSEAEKIRSIASRRFKLNYRFFSNIFTGLTPRVRAEYVFSWAYRYHGINDKPNDFAFGSAVERYADGGRLDEALRIASAFPFLPEAEEVFRAHPETSIKYMFDRYEKGEETHHAANSLGCIYKILGNYCEALKWFDLALSDEGTSPARIERISSQVDEARSLLEHSAEVSAVD